MVSFFIIEVTTCTLYNVHDLVKQELINNNDLFTKNYNTDNKLLSSFQKSCGFLRQLIKQVKYLKLEKVASMFGVKIRC